MQILGRKSGFFKEEFLSIEMLYGKLGLINIAGYGAEFYSQKRDCLYSGVATSKTGSKAPSIDDDK